MMISIIFHTAMLFSTTTESPKNTKKLK
jgi:hypothetical protein